MPSFDAGLQCAASVDRLGLPSSQDGPQFALSSIRADRRTQSVRALAAPRAVPRLAAAISSQWMCAVAALAQSPPLESVALGYITRTTAERAREQRRCQPESEREPGAGVRRGVRIGESSASTRLSASAPG